MASNPEQLLPSLCGRNNAHGAPVRRPVPVRQSQTVLRAATPKPSVCCTLQGCRESRRRRRRPGRADDVAVARMHQVRLERCMTARRMSQAHRSGERRVPGAETERLFSSRRPRSDTRRLSFIAPKLPLPLGGLGEPGSPISAVQPLPQPLALRSGSSCSAEAIGAGWRRAGTRHVASASRSLEATVSELCLNRRLPPSGDGVSNLETGGLASHQGDWPITNRAIRLSPSGTFASLM